MKYPESIKNRQSSFKIDSFFGINRCKKSHYGEFTDMENILSDDYPCLSSCPLPKKILERNNIVKWIIPKYSDSDISTFSGIIETENENGEIRYNLIINGEIKEKLIKNFTDAVDFNGQIITIPDFVGYDYINGIKIKPLQVSRKLDFSNNNDGSYRIEYDTKVIKKARFKVGDSVIISGLSKDKNNTYITKNKNDKSEEDKAISVTVTKSDEKGITVIGYDINGNPFEFNTDASEDGTITLRTPKAAFACMNKNRLWVLSDTGETIHASELGLPLQLYNYGTKATDAWYGDVGTPGKFTGLATYHDKILAFKEDELHIVFGDTPMNFSIHRNYSVGCIDGKSVANVNGQVIWLYHDGFYSYSGGKPKRISQKLNTVYKSCTAFSDNKRYYAVCKKKNGNKETLVYDTEYDAWYKISDIGSNILGGEYFNGKTYACAADCVYSLFDSVYGNFYAESTDINPDNFADNSILYFYIRFIPEGENSFVNIYTSVNGGEWIPHKGIAKIGKSRLPIRYSKGDTFRFRLEGNGKITITDIEIMKITENR